MAPRLKKILREAFRISVLVALFAVLENQVVEIHRELRGNTRRIAEAQGLHSQELAETRNLIRTALDDSNLQFTQARKVLEESTERIQGERQELARLIETRTGDLASTLKDRLETERSLLEGARTHAQTNVALIQRLERALDNDLGRMKRMMVYPTAQLRGSGTVGSGVLIYSEPQGESGVVTLILTAHHVVMEVMGDKAHGGMVDEVRILGENEGFESEVFAAEMVLCDRERDTALLRLKSSRRFPHTAELAPREALRRLDVFTRAYAVGCPLGNRPLPSVGEISSKNKVVGGQVYWMLNAPTFFGNSGGGIFLASTCQLIGISSMIYTYGKDSPTVVPHMGLFMSMESIYDWLEAEGHTFVTKRAPVPPALLARYGIGKASTAPGGQSPRSAEEAVEREANATDAQASKR